MRAGLGDELLIRWRGAGRLEACEHGVTPPSGPAPAVGLRATRAPFAAGLTVSPPPPIFRFCPCVYFRCTWSGSTGSVRGVSCITTRREGCNCRSTPPAPCCTTGGGSRSASEGCWRRRASCCCECAVNRRGQVGNPEGWRRATMNGAMNRPDALDLLGPAARAVAAAAGGTVLVQAGTVSVQAGIARVSFARHTREACAQRLLLSPARACSALAPWRPDSLAH